MRRDGKLNSKEALFYEAYIDPKRGDGNAAKTAALVWPKKYGNYKKDPKVERRAIAIGSHYVRRLRIEISDAFDALGFTVVKRAQYGLGLLNAKKIIRDNTGTEIAQEPDNPVRSRAWENITRLCGDHIIRHEITALEGTEPSISRGVDLSALSDSELMETGRLIGLRPEQMLAVFIKVRGVDAESGCQPIEGDQGASTE